MSPEDDMLAAEYVLGTLPLPDRARAEARLRDPAFAAAVADWELRLSSLNDSFAEAPAPDLMPRIEARLFPAPPARGWRFALWGASLASAASVALWLALVPLTPPMTATLQGEGTRYAASFDGTGLTIRRDLGAVDGDHSAELWLIVGEAAPLSLGVIGAEAHIPMSDMPEGAVLAVTLEPLGGSPSGKPTGPVLAAGPLQQG